MNRAGGEWPRGCAVCSIYVCARTKRRGGKKEVLSYDKFINFYFVDFYVHMLFLLFSWIKLTTKHI